MKDQYNVESTGVVAVTPAEKVSTNTAEQRKIANLESELHACTQELARLRRDMSRLKSDVSDIVAALRNG
jgi:septal ring factor EnvC (AmiA/AmiB activator)